MLTTREKQIRKQLRDDFEYYAPRCLIINTKQGTTERFKLNKAQQYVHSQLEAQLAAKGRVRALIVKGRQMGCSTYIQGRYLWKTTHRKAIKAFILTHSHSATAALYSMTRRYYDNLPEIVKPVLAKNNSAELDFRVLDSGYRVSTAASSGVGRGSTITLFHGSEVAYWANGEDHIPGILQAVPDADNTEVILESTANGPSGIFHKMCIDAYLGKTEYQVIFVPWWWQDEYSDPVDLTFQLTPEELGYMQTNGCTIGNMAWRRRKILQFVRGVADFRREYPATIEEAFTAEAQNALWSREDFENITYERFLELKEYHGEIETCIGFDPAGSTNAASDECGVIAATLLADDKVYVLHDLSGRHPPDKIVPNVKNLYYKIDADNIVIETNYGGHWVVNTFAMEDPNMVIRTTHARKGKRLRAEPVAHAYRQRKVVHVGDMTMLETEQCSWNPYDTNAPSPNRIDACVYAVASLLNIFEPVEQPIIWSSV